MNGRLVDVREVVAGSELAADYVAASTTLLVVDATDFNPEGGLLALVEPETGDEEEESYTAVDEATGTITLATALAGTWPAESRVELRPRTVELVAHVAPAELGAEQGDERSDDVLEVRVPHSLRPLVEQGLRSSEQGDESVEYEQQGDALVLTDVLGQEAELQAGIVIGEFSGIRLPHGLNVDSAPAASRIVWVRESDGAMRAQLVAGDDYLDRAAVSVVAGDPDLGPGFYGGRTLITEDGGAGMYRGWGMHDALDYYDPEDGLLDWTIDPLLVGDGTFAMLAQRLYGVAFVARRNLTITSVVTRVTTAGTSFNNWNGAAIYLWDDISGGAGTMGWLFLRDTGTTNNGLYNATGERELALTSPLGPVTPGNVLYVALLSSFTGTAPVILGRPNAHMVNAQRADMYANGGVSSRTTRPNVDFAHSALSPFTNVPWVGLK